MQARRRGLGSQGRLRRLHRVVAVVVRGVYSFELGVETKD